METSKKAHFSEKTKSLSKGVYVVYVGGTIGMKKTKKGYRPGIGSCCLNDRAKLFVQIDEADA